MNNQHLAIGQEVVFVSGGKNHKGKITQVYGTDSAQIEFDGGMAIAEFSEDKKQGTFHFEQASPKAESGKHEAHNQHKKE